MIKTSLQNSELSDDIIDIILGAWRKGTVAVYRTAIKKWINFCVRRNVDCFRTTIALVLHFLHSLFLEGLSYSSINTARSALSAFVHTTNDMNIRTHHLVTRFMKGIFNKRPPIRPPNLVS